MRLDTSSLALKRLWAADTAAWVAYRMAWVPAPWQGRVQREYVRRCKEKEAIGNTWLREITESMQGLLLPISATDDDIRAKADDLAEQCLRTCGAVTTGTVIERYDAAVRFCEARGVQPACLPERTLFMAGMNLGLYVCCFGAEVFRDALEESAGPCLARMMDALWWRRRLRAQHARLIEQHAIGLGYVQASREKYVSDIACVRRDQQKRRNAKTLEAVNVVNQFGECFTLADLAERSNANPRIRRSELMTRIAGFEAVARDLGHVAEFVTLTAPSRFHAKGGFNPKYDGSSPREAQAWLCKTWQLIRAWAARQGVRFYGFRVAEPHQDGCPHWHLLLFMPKAAVARFRAKFRRYAMRVEVEDTRATVADLAAQNKAQGMKRGFAKLARLQAAQIDHAHKVSVRQAENADRDRKRHGCQFVAVEMSATKSAAGYIAKYISKNIDGYNVQLDLYGHDAVEGAARIEAWAATHGTRQFQQIGGAPVGVWRELRRLREADAETTETLEAARAAADAGAWSDYTRIQGGPTVKRADLALTLAKTRDGEGWDAANLCPRPQLATRYGEPPAPAVFGVMDQRKGRSVITRFFNWTVERSTQPAPSAGQKMLADTQTAWSLPAHLGHSPVQWVKADLSASANPISMEGFGVPWTRVNNCTHPLDSEAGNEEVMYAETADFEPYAPQAEHDDWEEFDRIAGLGYSGGGGSMV